MNTETVTVHPKGDGFEIIVLHDQTGSAYGIDLSKNAYEQLRLHFVVGQSEQFYCNCSRAKGLDHDENGMPYCIECQKPVQ